MPRKGSASKASKGGKHQRGLKTAAKKEKSKAAANASKKNYPSELTSAFGTHSAVRVNSRIDIWWQGEGQWVPCKVVDRSGDAGVGRSRRATRTSSTCDVTVQYDDGTHTHHLAIEPGGSPKLQGAKAVRKARGVLELVPWRPSQCEPFGFDNAVQPGDLVRVYWSKPPPWTAGSDTTTTSKRARGSWYRGTVVDVGEPQRRQTVGESQPGVIRYDVGSRQGGESSTAESSGEPNATEEHALILHDFSKERWEKLRATRRRSSSSADVHQDPDSNSSTPKPSAASSAKKATLRRRSSTASNTPSSATSRRRSVSRNNSMESSPTSPASKSTKSSTATSSPSPSSSTTASASRKKKGASTRPASSSKSAKLSDSSPRYSKASSLTASCTAFLNFAIGAAKTVLHPNLTTAPETMPGRTAEHLRLRQFLDACLQGKGQGNNIYLGGRPGTGKTATVKKICTELLREQQARTGAARAQRSPKSTASSSSSGKKRKSKTKREGRTVRGVSSSGNAGPPGAVNRQIMTVLEINSARDIVQPGDIFEVVRAQLQHELQAQGLPPSALLRDAAASSSAKGSGSGAAKTMLEHYFCGNGARSTAALRRRGMVVLVVDEMENLLGTADMNSNVLHPLFEWARRRESRLILVGISNEIELIEQYLPQLRTRKIAPELLLFRPYSEAQLREILESRVAALHARIAQYNKTRAVQDSDRGTSGQRKLPPRTPRKAHAHASSSATHASSAVASDNYEFEVEFDPKALQLCCRKVAGLSGDARKNLSLFWQATDQCLQKLRDSSISQNMCTQRFMVGVPAVHAVLKASLQSKFHVQILRLPAKAKILLATFAGFVNNATGDNNHSVHRGASHSMLYRRYLDVCEKDLHESRHESGGPREFNSLLSVLEEGRLIALDTRAPKSSSSGSRHAPGKKRAGSGDVSSSHFSSGGGTCYQLLAPFDDICSSLEQNPICRSILARSTHLSRKEQQGAGEDAGGGGGGGGKRKRARNGTSRQTDDFDPLTTDSRLQAAPGAFSYTDNDDAADDEYE